MTRLFGKSILCGALLALGLASCSKEEEEEYVEEPRPEIDPELAAIEVDAQVTSNAAGTVRATIDYGVPNTQVVKVPAELRIAGTQLAFLPYSFEETIEIVMAEGAPVAHRKNLDALGVESTVLQVSTPVVLTWTYDEDTQYDFRYQLKKPDYVAVANDDAGVSRPEASVAVVFRKNTAEVDGTRLGIISADKIKEVNGWLEFETSSYGIYQLVKFDTQVNITKEVESTEVLKTNTVSGEEKPGAFNLTGPIQDLSSQPYLGSNDVLTWDPSDYATSFDVSISSSADCSSPAKSYADVKAISRDLSELATGSYFYCVTAKNANGTVAATNNGQLGFTVETEAPAKPAPPQQEAKGSGILEYSWPEASDRGPAGISHYNLQVGTTAGGADIYDFAVINLSAQIIGEVGSAHYSRVQVVDKAGNKSEWSEVSAALTP